MYIHSVYFWLKPELTKEQHQAFTAGLATLRKLEVVNRLYIGTPAPSDDSSIVDSSYSYGLVVEFNDQAGHDVYIPHPLHLAFVEKFSSYWTKVLIYDFD